MNTFFYGDNLNILRRYIESESVDLVYLDPLFNSTEKNRVREESGQACDSRDSFSAPYIHIPKYRRGSWN